jgi:hypothetical protein
VTDPVEEGIIKPMVASFPAPHHVRGDHEATEALLTIDRKALSGFDRETLEQAWQKVAAEQTHWLWPMPRVIVQAAQHYHKLAHPAAKADDAWIERAQALSDDYTKRFM